MGVSSRQQLAQQATACQAGHFYFCLWLAMINIDIVSFPWTHFLHLLVKGQHWGCSCVYLQRLDLLWFLHWTGRWFKLWSCGTVTTLETTTIPATNCHQWYQPTVSTRSNHCHCDSNRPVFNFHHSWIPVRVLLMVGFVVLICSSVWW